MNNCSYCGGLLRHEKVRHVCTVCGKTFYDNPKAAVAIILYSEDKKSLSFGVRKHEPSKGLLDCMGGFVDVGESFEQATLRELNEESGLTKDDLLHFEYAGSCYDGYPWEGTVVPVTSAYFMAQLKPGVVLKAGDDIASITTVAVSDIVYEDFAWDGMRDVVRVVVQRLAAM